jgi:hypothetical protein
VCLVRRKNVELRAHVWIRRFSVGAGEFTEGDRWGGEVS